MMALTRTDELLAQLADLRYKVRAAETLSSRRGRRRYCTLATEAQKASVEHMVEELRNRMADVEEELNDLGVSF